MFLTLAWRLHLPKAGNLFSSAKNANKAVQVVYYVAKELQMLEPMTMKRLRLSGPPDGYHLASGAHKSSTNAKIHYTGDVLKNNEDTGLDEPIGSFHVYPPWVKHEGHNVYRTLRPGARRAFEERKRRYIQDQKPRTQE